MRASVRASATKLLLIRPACEVLVPGHALGTYGSAEEAGIVSSHQAVATQMKRRGSHTSDVHSAFI